MKIKRLLSLIALLLVMALLLASCSIFDDPFSDPGDDPNKGPGESNPNEPGPYIDLAEAWTEYISYAKPEADKVYGSDKFITELENKGVVWGDILVVNESREVKVTREPNPEEAINPDMPNEVTVNTIVTTKWYNVNTGALIRTFVSDHPVFDGGIADKSVDIGALVKYDASYLAGYGIYKVVKTNYTLKQFDPPAEGVEAPVVDPLDISNYDTNRSYSYYFADGSEFLKDLESEISFRGVKNESAIDAGRFLVDCLEKSKTYLMQSGELVCEFGYNMEYDVPVYNENSFNIGGTGYAYFEKNENKYIITEATPVMKPIGDLYQYMVPAINIYVTDANDNILANYTSECHGIWGYAVLSNGNIYICESEILNSDAEDYDFKSGEEKLNTNHKIISITDGSVTTLDLSFTATKLLNDTTKEIRSFINVTTLEATDPDNMGSSILSKVDVKDGYILATIQKYADGAIDPNSTFAILNENLEIVAELPKIIVNQFTYPSFIYDDTMIVSTRTAYNSVVYYAVGVEDGNAHLLPSLGDLMDIDPIENGYVWWYEESCKVYDKNWELLVDYTDNDDYAYRSNFRILNDKLYYDYNYYGSMVIRDSIVEDIYSYEGGYELNRETVVDYAEFSSNDGIIVNNYYSEPTYYNIDGGLLVDTGDAYEDRIVYYNEYEAITYYGYASVESFVSTDSGYLVCLRVDWSRNDYYDLPLSEYPMTYCEYEYIVIN